MKCSVGTDIFQTINNGSADMAFSIIRPRGYLPPKFFSPPENIKFPEIINHSWFSIFVYMITVMY